MTYFEVTDTAEAADWVVELGGQVREPTHDTTHGQVAVVADAEGAMFALVHTPR
ncbi:VOC family protein [Streptomyces sp. NPDC002845]